MTGTAARTGDGVVTVCIPAWQAASFIERTLRCALAQTHPGLRIVVSIDASDDDTERICREQADRDGRISVTAHRERLGWAANVNHLLDRADTEFAVLYVHDDLIEPAYCERLVTALRRRPDAASAHCDLGHFGGGDHVAPAHAYEGSAADRLFEFLVTPAKGSMLRSMVRTARIGPGVRLPTDSRAGVWANEPFLMRLVAAGPVLAVPEVLYRRWDKRRGGLTDGWTALPFAEILDGYRVNAASALALVDRLDPTPGQRELLRFGLLVYLMPRVRLAEQRHGAVRVTAPEEIHPVLTDGGVPAAVDGLPEVLRGWCLRSYAHFEALTAERAREVEAAPA